MEEQLDTPEQIKPHAADYQPQAWQNYTTDELAAWVHLLRKRAEHCTDETKKAKDLYDAESCLSMLREHVGSDHEAEYVVTLMGEFLEGTEGDVIFFGDVDDDDLDVFGDNFIFDDDDFED